MRKMIPYIFCTLKEKVRGQSIKNQRKKASERRNPRTSMDESMKGNQLFKLWLGNKIKSLRILVKNRLQGIETKF